MEKVVVNVLGKPCPIPVVEATKALQALGNGVLEVLVDNEVAVQNLTRMAASRGLTAVAKKVSEHEFSVTIVVSGSVSAADNAPACTPDRRTGTVVAIGASQLGRGSEELGATLMKGFLYALSQQEALPAAVILFNGGAKLPIAGSASLEDLRTLEASGVEILTCGTCLNFYGLTDQLAVGSVTNMYTIAEKLSAADRVINL
ncbi:MAG: sulfurtransferase-like selenium metabolism protein YedF [Oscillospiraceae bacterium]|nr:sulfurtransferase-like selenium metabolism protein YedF [Oscillospiraceae bacterium]